MHEVDYKEEITQSACHCDYHLPIFRWHMKQWSPCFRAGREDLLLATNCLKVKALEVILQSSFDAIVEGVSARAAELLDQEGTKERENQKDYSNFDKRDHRIGRSDKSVGIAADPHLRCSLTQDQCLPIMNPQIVWGGHKRDEIYPMASNPRKGTW